MQQVNVQSNSFRGANSSNGTGNPNSSSNHHLYTTQPLQQPQPQPQPSPPQPPTQQQQQQQQHPNNQQSKQQPLTQHHVHQYNNSSNSNSSGGGNNNNHSDSKLSHGLISIKSKIGVEFRRYALRIDDVRSFDSFYKKIESFHQLSAIPFVIFYTDSEDFLLPINNDDNLAKAISSAKQITLQNNSTNCNNNQQQTATATTTTTTTTTTIKRPFLKLFIEKKGIFLDYYNGNLSGKYKKNQHFKGFPSLLQSSDQGMRPSIGMPEDFRQVSSIIDVDIVPETCRRVRIVKHGSDRPLGFYIRDGTYKRMNAQGQIEEVVGIFISRLVPGGLAESTGLLAVNDEVLEVNGIQVTQGKTLDQVTDMMVANSSNLIITIRPGKLNNNLS